MASTRNTVKKDVINPLLTDLINNLKRGSRVISGSLSVSPGHDYWWFLEYGTGQYFGDEDPPYGELEQPAATDDEEPEGGPYEISVDSANYLVYMTMVGGKRYIRRKATEHPGIRPIGMVRTALFDAMLYLKRDLDLVTKRKGKWKDLPRRKDLVALVNEILTILLGTLRLLTPDDSDPDPYHKGRHPTPLSQAWKITKAK